MTHLGTTRGRCRQWRGTRRLRRRGRQRIRRLVRMRWGTVILGIFSWKVWRWERDFRRGYCLLVLVLCS
ncbi:hypothetical protein LINPERPRIM_LOCUS24203 [Linum perenne]